MRFMTSQEAQFRASTYPLYTETCAKLQVIFNELKKAEEIGQEGLNSSFIGRLFVSVVDVFTGLALTFKSNMTRFYKSVKRSELHEFIDSNKVKTAVVYRIPFEKVYDYNIDVPANLGGTYKEAITAVENVFIKLNAVPIAQATLASLKNILRAMTTADPGVSDLISTSSNVIDRQVKVVKPVVLECQKNFSGKFAEKKQFKDVFLTVAELRDCVDKLLALEPRLQDAHKLNGFVTEMEQVLKGMVKAIETTPENQKRLTPKELTQLGETAKGTALLFDAYGLAAMRQLALEHNLVLDINNIYANVK